MLRWLNRNLYGMALCCVVLHFISLLLNENQKQEPIIPAATRWVVTFITASGVGKCKETQISYLTAKHLPLLGFSDQHSKTSHTSKKSKVNKVFIIQSSNLTLGMFAKTWFNQLQKTFYLEIEMNGFLSYTVEITTSQVTICKTDDP